MKKVLFYLAIFFAYINVLNSQDLKSIYEQLEYKTDPQNGYYETWRIDDRKLIREVFVKLINRGALIDASGKVWTMEDFNDKIGNDVFNGNIKIICQKRYYDDEIAKINFVNSINPSNVPGEIKDWIYLSDLLDNLYVFIKAKKYSHTDLTKKEYSSEQKYNIDMYLNGLNPRLMLWNNVDGDLAQNSFWVVSAFGRMGFDQINLPLWYKGSVIAGLNVDYIDNVNKKDRDYKRFSIYLGIDEPVNFSIKSKSSSSSQIFKEKILTGLGTNFLAGATYTLTTPGGFGSFGEYIVMNGEASINITEKKKERFDINKPVFNVVKNVTSASAIFKHADFGFARVNGTGLFNYGLGLAWFSSTTMSIISPTDKLKKVASIKSNGVVSPEFGISQDGDLIQYSITVNYSHHFSPDFNPYGYIGIKSLFMLSNFIGFDVRYYKAVFNSKNIPEWQYDSYIVFSPILRINY